MPHDALSIEERHPTILGRGYGTISTSAVAIADLTGITAAMLTKAKRCVMNCHNGGVHYLYTGDAPTAEIGHMMAENERPVAILGNAAINNLQWIKDTGGNDSVVTVTLES